MGKYLILFIISIGFFLIFGSFEKDVLIMANGFSMENTPSYIIGDETDCTANVPTTGFSGQEIQFIGTTILDKYPPDSLSPSLNLAYNPSGTGYPSPLESDSGWGGGSYPWEIVDGIRVYPEWAHGLAFTGGTLGYVEPCGWRQSTINFGTPKTFDRVFIWHHGFDHIPNTYSIQYWDGVNWVDVFSTTDGHSYIKFPLDDGQFWAGGSIATDNSFPPVTSEKVRILLYNCDITHGWLYEFEVFLTPSIDWDFGDGSAHGSGQNPTHIYQSDGIYTWTMTVNNGGSTCQRTGTITIGSSSSISITSPNGGESWLVGSSQSITWSSTGFTGNIALDYSKDDGSNWISIIDSTSNTGLYNWTIPNEAISSQCRIRVKESSSGIPVDISDQTFVIYDGISSQERGVLIALYTATNGDGWTNNNGWKIAPLFGDGFALPGTEDNWFGIETTGNAITGITLNANNLSGIIPVQIGTLLNLAHLDFSNNNLTGIIPIELGNLVNLTFLNLCYNQLSGSIPIELGNLVNLESLGLGHNPISGSIPVQLENLGKLKYLYLSDGELSGEIPPQLGNIVNLLDLYLYNNQLSGNIPIELGNLIHLERLHLFENHLTGSIPVQLGNLGNLQSLILGNNELTGHIPESLGNLSNLKNLELNQNALTGVIPTTFGNLSNLSYLLLSNNSLSGGIPTELGNLSRLETLNLNSCQLGGDIPENLVNLTAMTQLDIGYNCLKANDPILINWLDTHDPDWESIQDNCLTITITSPNGDELWLFDSKYDITWNTTGIQEEVKIEYTPDEGINWTTIAESAPNTGSYSWKTPNIPSSRYKIRITMVGGNPVDVSDAVFSIYSNPARWVPVEYMENNMIAYGKAYYNNNVAAQGDYIAAFGPGGFTDCRGVGVIGDDGDYYLTIRSNAVSGETITFQLFPMPSGPSVESSETVSFIVDEVYTGLPLHFGLNTQDIPLVTGWNWLSFNALPEDTSLNAVLNELNGEVVQIKSQTQSAIFSNDKWIGDLTNLNGIADGKMYKIKTIEPCSLSITGTTIPFNKPIYLGTGWNWITYFPTLPLPVETAMASIMPQLLQVKCQIQAAVNEGNCLIGDLVEMTPNSGYTIKTNAPGTLIYPFGMNPEIDNISNGIQPEANTADSSETPYQRIQGNQYNMVAMGNLYLEGKTINHSGFYLISIGPGGEKDCRSISPIGNNGSFFSTILGNANGETVKFKLYDSSKKKTYSVKGSISFQADDLKSNLTFRTQSVKIITPTGGESIIMGSVCPLTWEAYEISMVKIELYKGGKSVCTIVPSIGALTGNYQWTLPIRLDSGIDYRIRISSIDTGVLAEAFSNNFSIQPVSTLALNAPTGGELWQNKRSYDITWGSSGINNIKIELYKNNVLFNVIAESYPASSGKYTWTVPANHTLGTDYKIKLSSADIGINLSDTCKANFAIVPYKRTSADFNNDGISDILWRYHEPDGYNCIWLIGTSACISSLTDPRLASFSVTIPAEMNLDNIIAGTGDFNHDGNEDILWRNSVNGINYIWLMNNTTVTGSVQISTESKLSWNICGTGDFNNDGNIDIVWRNQTNGSNRIWLMNGLTKSSEIALTSETDLEWNISGTGDFNNNGTLDILWRNSYTGNNRVWFMNGTILDHMESLSSVNADWEISDIGDYDGNGKPDICWRNNKDGRISIWYMDGLSRQYAVTLSQVTDLNWKIKN